MSDTIETELRDQLLDRRQRLTRAIADLGGADDLTLLLREVDSALQRVASREYRCCDVCGTDIEDHTLRMHPTIRYCLCELSAQQRDALQHDLEMAQRVQLSLLPPPNVEIAGWEAHSRYLPAGPVGGDFCDVVAPATAPRTLYFWLGDVSGKGVAASLGMARLSALLRSLIEQSPPLHELVAGTNRLFSQNLLDTHYATVVCGRADDAGSVEICNAGHCPPLVVRDGIVAPVNSTGYPVGLVGGDHSYDSCRLQLEPGESLVLYSDGVTETFDGDGRSYGLEGLTSVLARSRQAGPAALAAACLSDLAGFRNSAPQQDDLTILVLRRAG